MQPHHPEAKNALLAVALRSRAAPALHNIWIRVCVSYECSGSATHVCRSIRGIEMMKRAGTRACMYAKARKNTP